MVEPKNRLMLFKAIQIILCYKSRFVGRKAKIKELGSKMECVFYDGNAWVLTTGWLVRVTPSPHPRMVSQTDTEF